MRKEQEKQRAELVERQQKKEEQERLERERRRRQQKEQEEREEKDRLRRRREEQARLERAEQEAGLKQKSDDVRKALNSNNYTVNHVKTGIELVRSGHLEDKVIQQFAVKIKKSVQTCCFKMRVL